MILVIVNFFVGVLLFVEFEIWWLVWKFIFFGCLFMLVYFLLGIVWYDLNEYVLIVY